MMVIIKGIFDIILRPTTRKKPKLIWIVYKYIFLKIK
jgi:hypothetical protein